MKKFILSLMVLGALVSCGKNNQVSSATAAGSNAITINDQVAIQLGSLIDTSETNFGNGLASYGLTWNQVIASYPYYSYKYGTTSGSTSSNCTTKWSIFYVCTLGTTSTSGATVSRSVVANQVDLATKRNELKAIINSSVPGGIQVSGSVFYVRTSTGIIYSIDTRLPVQANPSATQQVNGQVEYFLGLSQ